MTNKMQMQIDLMTETLMQRLEFFVDQEDYATSDAIYNEYVVEEYEHDDEAIGYEWLFLTPA